MIDSNDFYVYCYKDPRKPGNFKYNDIEKSFDYEPFYIGKGHNKRYLAHLENWSLKSNTLKDTKIKAIRNLGLNPYIEILFSNITETLAFNIEKKYIKSIGRYDQESGPLCNMTDGGEGTAGYVMSDEWIKKNRLKRLGMKHSEKTIKRMKEYWKKQAGIKRPAHIGMKISNSKQKLKEKIRGINHGKTKWIYMLSNKDINYITSDLTTVCENNNLCRHTIDSYLRKGINKYKEWKIERKLCQSK